MCGLIKRVAKGALGGLLLGGPMGAVGGVAGSLIGGKKRKKPFDPTPEDYSSHPRGSQWDGRRRSLLK